MPGPDDDLPRDLRAYVEGVSSPVDAFAARTRAERRIERRRRAASAAIAVVTIALIGGAIAVLNGRNGGRSAPPAGSSTTSELPTAPPTTHAVPSTTTTAPTTAPTIGPPPTVVAATGTWDDVVAGPDGVFAFQRHGPSGTRLARLDSHARIVASRSGVPIDRLRLDTAGALYGTGQGGNGTAEYVFDARTLAQRYGQHVTTVVSAAAHGTTVWLASANQLERQKVPTATGGGGALDVPVSGPPVVSIAVDPSGARVYVLQFDAARQQSALSVRSAVDGHLLLAAKWRATGPAAGRVAATNRSVWLVQPTGTQGYAQRFDGSTLAAIGFATSTSNHPLLVASGPTAVFGPTALMHLECTSESRSGAVGVVALRDAPLSVTTDGARVYVALAGGGIQSVALPPVCG